MEPFDVLLLSRVIHVYGHVSSGDYKNLFRSVYVRSPQQSTCDYLLAYPQLRVLQMAVCSACVWYS